MIATRIVALTRDRMRSGQIRWRRLTFVIA